MIDPVAFGRRMPTNRITPSSSLIETLRLLAKDRTREGSGAAQKKLAMEEARHDVQALRQQLRALATDVDTTDERAMRQLRNNTVREILLWEFGNDFRTDSQFVPMMETINQALDADPTMQQRFAGLVLDLRKAQTT